MRLLSLAMALAFTAGSISIAQACPHMQNADSKEQQTVAVDKAPKSTPIVIPQKKKADS